MLFSCFCGAEGSKGNPPDVYINFIYKLSGQKDTSWYNNEKNNHDDERGGTFEFKHKFPRYKKKDGKVG